VPAPLTRAGTRRAGAQAATRPRASDRRRRAPATALLAVAACTCALQAAPARASTQAVLHASFAPDRLGASTALTLALSFSGGGGGVPAPLRTLALRLPAGLGIELRGSSVCPPARLRSRGAAGCPPAALLGRGHARMEVHAGSQTIPESAVLWVFRGPPGARGATTLEILGAGSTPLDERTLSTGVLSGERAPFGSRLTVAVPPIPTVVFEPDASFDSLSLTIGMVGNTPRARAAGVRILVPRRCPPAGFPFAAAVSFADGSRASAATVAPCP
jgi:hypothetical protein